MKELEILLNKRWVLKSRDKETYYKLRDALGELRKFTTEKMGCQIIDNSLLIKMEKIPVIPESFMGIQKFSSKEEYAYLCILLMFLEDRDAQEQFIISQLTEYITANLPGEISDWTLYTNRRKLIRVMRFAADQGLIGVTDGKDEAFMDDEGGEVLYENTGASRYFMKSFSKDIMEYTKPEDFQESDWFEVDEDRGFARRHRVYKRLIFAPGMYKADGSSEDFEYLKYYGRRLSEELEQIFDCHVHIHKGSAYLLSGDDCRMGTVFPGNNSISDILLLCFREIRKKIEKGQWKTGLDETCLIDQIEFENMIKEIKQEYGSGFSKNYREMPEGEFVKSVLDEMKLWMFIRKEELAHQIKICPLTGKILVHYLMPEKAKHFLIQLTFLQSIEMVERSLSSPAQENSGCHMGLGPVHDLGNFLPVINLFKLHLLYRCSCNDHSIKLLIFQFRKSLIKFVQMTPGSVFRLMGLHCHKAYVNLQRSIGKRAKKLKLGFLFQWH